MQKLIICVSLPPISLHYLKWRRSKCWIPDSTLTSFNSEAFGNSSITSSEYFPLITVQTDFRDFAKLFFLYFYEALQEVILTRTFISIDHNTCILKWILLRSIRRNCFFFLFNASFRSLGSGFLIEAQATEIDRIVFLNQNSCSCGRWWVQ